MQHIPDIDNERRIRATKLGLGISSAASLCIRTVFFSRVIQWRLQFRPVDTWQRSISSRSTTLVSHEDPDV